MKTVSYGNEIDNAEIATSNLELLVSDDKISANSINRTIQNIYEDCYRGMIGSCRCSTSSVSFFHPNPP
jgi:hypothetical protein